jgi:hypothetical protein
VQTQEREKANQHSSSIVDTSAAVSTPVTSGGGKKGGRKESKKQQIKKSDSLPRLKRGMTSTKRRVKTNPQYERTANTKTREQQRQ